MPSSGRPPPERGQDHRCNAHAGAAGTCARSDVGAPRRGTYRGLWRACGVTRSKPKAGLLYRARARARAHTHTQRSDHRRRREQIFVVDGLFCKLTLAVHIDSPKTLQVTAVAATLKGVPSHDATQSCCHSTRWRSGRRGDGRQSWATERSSTPRRWWRLAWQRLGQTPLRRRFD